ncbi:MAG: hypothetical protein R3230_00750 [Nitrosopumilaceae archaeon]|nr:hypothetical protein [Nitrosopumilaceae archaeon]
MSIDEQKKKVRVSSSGEKTRRVKCKPGFKLNSNGTSCVPMTGKEKQTRKKAAKKAVRKKRSKSQAQTQRKRLKALKRRKSLGVK